MVRIFVLIICAGFIAAGMMGCASGTKYTDLKDSIPPLNPEKGRIYFYRSSVVGAAIQPIVILNDDDTVGKAVSHGFWYVDRPPGKYSVVAGENREDQLILTLEAGQTQYVKLSVSFGRGIYGHLVDEKLALKELKGCNAAFEFADYVPTPALKK